MPGGQKHKTTDAYVDLCMLDVLITWTDSSKISSTLVKRQRFANISATTTLLNYNVQVVCFLTIFLTFLLSFFSVSVPSCGSSGTLV